MSDRLVFSREEFVAAAGIGEEDLARFEEAGILVPAGRADRTTPFYDAGSVAEARKILGLVELGYDVKEIARIRKKVGLPAGGKEGRPADRAALLSVGELARRAGTSPRTIKHWEEKGIIEPDSHSPGGFRLYREHYVFFCQLIRDLQVFGYTLEEIKDVSDLFRDFHVISRDHGHFPPDKALAKLSLMDEKIAALAEKMDQMEEGIHRWRGLLKEKSKQIRAFGKEIRRKTGSRTAGAKAGAKRRVPKPEPA